MSPLGQNASHDRVQIAKYGYTKNVEQTYVELAEKSEQTLRGIVRVVCTGFRSGRAIFKERWKPETQAIIVEQRPSPRIQ